MTLEEAKENTKNTQNYIDKKETKDWFKRNFMEKKLETIDEEEM